MKFIDAENVLLFLGVTILAGGAYLQWGLGPAALVLGCCLIVIAWMIGYSRGGRS